MGGFSRQRRLDGFVTGDDELQLLQQLWRLPKEIEALYGHMLQSIDALHKTEAEVFFHIAIRYSRTDGSRASGASSISLLDTWTKKPKLLHES
jgi:hypothetical protein